jgi:hypothetical protein
MDETTTVGTYGRFGSRVPGNLCASGHHPSARSKAGIPPAPILLMTRPPGTEPSDSRQDILSHGDPVIPASARRNGIADDDMLHEYRNPVRVFEFDELAMLIGPDQAGRMLEVGLATAEGVEFVVHAMTARPKFLR